MLCVSVSKYIEIIIATSELNIIPLLEHKIFPYSKNIFECTTLHRIKDSEMICINFDELNKAFGETNSQNSFVYESHDGIGGIDIYCEVDRGLQYQERTTAAIPIQCE